MNTQKKMALIGATGRMGKCVIECAQSHGDWDITTEVSRDLSGLWDAASPPDIIIDFSNPEMTSALAKKAATKNIPLLICTTGLSVETVDALKKCAANCPVMIAPNTSIGVLVLQKMLEIAASMLDNTFDRVIIVTHHRSKIDAPSGTALSLRKTLHLIRTAPVGMHSIRAGDVIAEHSVSFRGDHEVVRLTHTAHSRHVFADGALRLANWLFTQKPGLYTPENVIPMFVAKPGGLE